MRNHHALKLILAGLIFIALSIPAHAQSPANTLINFLQETYNRYDSKL